MSTIDSAKEWLDANKYIYSGLRITVRDHNGDSLKLEEVLSRYAEAVATPSPDLQAVASKPSPPIGDEDAVKAIVDAYAMGRSTAHDDTVGGRYIDIGDEFDILREEVEHIIKPILTERGSNPDEEVIRFSPNSDDIIDGSAETWKAAGYDDPDRAAERFRGGLRQAFVVGWHESRMHLAGRSIVVRKPRKEESAPVPDEAEIERMSQTYMNKEWNEEPSPNCPAEHLDNEYVRIAFKDGLRYASHGATKEAVALTGVVAAWEALPEGRYTTAQVGHWINEVMKPAMDAARLAKSQATPPEPTT